MKFMLSGKNTTYKKIQYWKKHKVQGKQFTKETKGQRLPLTLNKQPWAHSLEVARCANVCLCQPLLLPPFDFFLPLRKGRVHNVVHLRIVVITLNAVDLWVFDIDSRHGQCGSWKMKKTVLKLQLI